MHGRAHPKMISFVLVTPHLGGLSQCFSGRKHNQSVIDGARVRPRERSRHEHQHAGASGPPLNSTEQPVGGGQAPGRLPALPEPALRARPRRDYHFYPGGGGAAPPSIHRARLGGRGGSCGSSLGGLQGLVLVVLDGEGCLLLLLGGKPRLEFALQELHHHVAVEHLTGEEQVAEVEPCAARSSPPRSGS